MILSNDVESLRTPAVELVLGHVVVSSALGLLRVLGAVGGEIVGALDVSSSDVSGVAVDFIEVVS